MADTELPHFSLRRTLARRLSDVEALLGAQVFLRRGRDWVEGARLGTVRPDEAEEILSGFNPERKGAVRALSEPPGRWRLVWMHSGGGLDICLVLILGDVPGERLQVLLPQIEIRAGWIVAAAHAEGVERTADVALGTEMTAALLLDAARASTQRQLADQWIARIEQALRPDLVAVTWNHGDAPKLAALSGGGLIERPSLERSTLELIATAAIRLNRPLVAAAAPDDPDTEGDPRATDPQRDAMREVLAQARVLGCAQAMALPLSTGDRVDAVIVALWREGRVPRPEAADLIAQVLTESLRVQRRAHPSILRRFGSWVSGFGRLVFGRTAWKAKLGVAIAVVGLAVMALLPSAYRPSFEARVEFGDRRILAAPFDGFLAEAPFRLGDLAPDEAVLVALLETDLTLQRAEAEAESARIETEAATARAQRNSAEVRTLEARAAQIVARLALLDAQIAAASTVADGPRLVVGGDAWRRVGARVRLGEPLLETASPDTVRVLAFIDEDWIGELAPGAAGTLLLASDPDAPIPVHLSEITSESLDREGRTVLVAWIDPSETGGKDLLDGMRGIVRLDAPTASMLAAYTRGPRLWLRRTLWKWGMD